MESPAKSAEGFLQGISGIVFLVIFLQGKALRGIDCRKQR